MFSSKLYKKKFLFCFFFLIFTTEAKAYIDPVSISSFLSILLAAIISGFYYLKIQVLDLIKKVIRFNSDIFKLVKFLGQKKEVVFFYETKVYKKYLISIIKKFDKEKKDYTILTSNDDEEINTFSNKFSFNTNFFLNIALNSIKCNILVTTSPDLNISNFKKSSFCKIYFYIFHSLVSTQMIYKKDAFKYFDVVACCTKYQKKELDNEQKKEINNNRDLIEAGYPLLNHLSQSDFNLSAYDRVMIAPSWQMDDGLFYKKYYENLINFLLEKKYKVILRPHPEFIKRFESNIDDIKKLFLNKDFQIDYSSCLKSVLESKYLITDWSGISMEYAFLTKRPVIFWETPIKINNKKFENNADLQMKMIEVKERDNLGLLLNDVNLVEKKLNEIDANSKKFAEKISNFFDQNLYNHKNSNEYVYKEILVRNNSVQS